MIIFWGQVNIFNKLYFFFYLIKYLTVNLGSDDVDVYFQSLLDDVQTLRIVPALEHIY